jgi:putative flippase GtrA
MNPPSRDSDGSDPTREETKNERMDRNWNELLQELRVTQTGIQILTGFLLTLPFQQRFTDLDEFQRDVFLVTVSLAAAATGLIIAPVSFHRMMFRQREKPLLVRISDRLARAGLSLLALAVSCVALLIFDVVVGRLAGVLASASLLAFFAVCSFVAPLAILRTRSSNRS